MWAGWISGVWVANVTMWWSRRRGGGRGWSGDACYLLIYVIVVVAVVVDWHMMYGRGNVRVAAVMVQAGERVDVDVVSMLRNETVSVHLPSSRISGTMMMPLVLLLHGVGGSGPELATYFGLADASEALEFAWVAPSGVRSRGCKPWSGNDRRWCGASCCGCCECDEGHILNNDARDSSFLRAMLEAILENTSLHIDPRRIHVLGRSNGGFMAYRLACEHADLIASIVTICAGFYKVRSHTHMYRCRASQERNCGLHTD